MREGLAVVTELTVVAINAMALVFILAGTVQAFVAGFRLMLGGTATGFEKREVWLRYARVLVAGLTFQLAADIIETSITTDWEAVARLAAIAVIRTFLNYFLERDLTEISKRQHQVPEGRTAEPTGVLE